MTTDAANAMDNVPLDDAFEADGRQEPRIEEVAVMIRDAVKIYGKNNVVLKRLNMTVPKGKM